MSLIENRSDSVAGRRVAALSCINGIQVKQPPRSCNFQIFARWFSGASAETFLKDRNWRLTQRIMILVDSFLHVEESALHETHRQSGHKTFLRAGFLFGHHRNQL